MGDKYEVLIANDIEGWFVARDLQTGVLVSGVREDCENPETHAKCQAAMSALQVN